MADASELWAWIHTAPLPAILLVFAVLLTIAIVIVLASSVERYARTIVSLQEDARDTAAQRRAMEKERDAAQTHGARLDRYLTATGIRLFETGAQPGDSPIDVARGIVHAESALDSTIRSKIEMLLAGSMRERSTRHELIIEATEPSRAHLLIRGVGESGSVVAMIDVSWLIDELWPQHPGDIPNQDALLRLGRLGIARVRRSGTIARPKGLLNRTGRIRIAMNISDVVAPAHHNRVMRAMERSFMSRAKCETNAYLVIGPNQSVWCNFQFRPSKAQGELYLVVRDASEVRAAQDEKIRYRAETQALKNILTKGSTRERSRIWAELHDARRWIERDIAEIGRVLKLNGNSECIVKIGMVAKFIRKLEDIASCSEPIQSETAAAAINRAVQRWREDFAGIAIIAEPLVDADLYPVHAGDADWLYLYAAEALRNAAKHSIPPDGKQKELRVSARKNREIEGNVIEIIDNGRRYDLEQVRRSLEKLSGSLATNLRVSVLSSSEGGCLVRLFVPKHV